MSFNPLPPQSPIDLEKALPLRYQLPADAVVLDWSNPGQGQLKQGDHGPEIEFAGSKATAKVRLPGYSAPLTFTLAKFHFHSESEHQVNGQRWPLEVHVVHTATEPDPWNPKVNRTIYAVVGVFIKPADDKKGVKKANDFFEEIVKNLRSAKLDELTPGKTIGGKTEYDPKQVLPFDAATPFTQVPYWRYEGSLTSKVDEPNDGDVSWIVLQQLLEVDPALLGEWLKLKHEAKLPQPLDRRVVFFSPGSKGG